MKAAVDLCLSKAELVALFLPIGQLVEPQNALSNAACSEGVAFTRQLAIHNAACSVQKRVHGFGDCMAGSES